MDQIKSDATTSAIIVPVPEAESVVGPHRQMLDHTVHWPFPAHVTVLYPFLQPSRITAGVIGDVRACLAGVQAFACEFSTVEWFGQDVLWLALIRTLRSASSPDACGGNSRIIRRTGVRIATRFPI